MTQLKAVTTLPETGTSTIKLTAVDAVRLGEFMRSVGKVRSVLSEPPQSITLTMENGKPGAVAVFDAFTLVMRNVTQ